jgi:starch synthase
MLEWEGVINPLASAIKCSWRFSTVSSSYLEEIKYKANGLQDIIRAESYKARGILNGIDVEVWNPATDAYLPYHFNKKTVKKEKFKNKAHLCKTFGLDPKKPLFAFIGRLVPDKGADIIAEICYQAFAYYKDQLNIIVLGSGNDHVQNQLETVKQYYPDRFANFTGYDESLAHLIYASADFLLMPSRVEPCGLNQMYALKYGTIPIVSRTGGLKDTILDIGDSGFGICHDHTSVSDVMHAIYRAIKLYEDTKFKDKIVQFIMDIDHSWEKVADEYVDMYRF